MSYGNKYIHPHLKNTVRKTSCFFFQTEKFLFAMCMYICMQAYVCMYDREGNTACTLFILSFNSVGFKESTQAVKSAPRVSLC